MLDSGHRLTIYGEHNALYGSKAQPKKIFGEDTPELHAFYTSMENVAPGAWALLQDLLESWNPGALYHAWKLPDGYDVKVKVMVKKSIRIEVDELDHSTFTYEFQVNEGTEKGLSNVANVVHSIDAYVLRSMHRRCNYDAFKVQYAHSLMTGAMSTRTYGATSEPICGDSKLAYYIDQYTRSNMPDVVIFNHLTLQNVDQVPTDLLMKLIKIAEDMLQFKPFELITVHDAFAALPSNCDALRFHYKEILADLADSNIVDDILSQLYGQPGKFDRLSTNLGDTIRKSNYALS